MRGGRVNPFKGCHYSGEIILLAVRRYLRYPLAYQHVAEMLAERGLAVDASCIWRWVQAYAPELNKRCRPHLRPTNKSYPIDETYIRIKGEDRYLYRALDSTGQTIDFLLMARRDTAAAKRFLVKAMETSGSALPRVMNVDKNRTALNDLGQVAGTVPLTANMSAAAIWSNGTVTVLGTLPGGSTTYVTGINDSGQVVCERRSKDIPVSGAGVRHLGGGKGNHPRSQQCVWSHRKGVSSGTIWRGAAGGLRGRDQPKGSGKAIRDCAQDRAENAELFVGLVRIFETNS